MLLLIFVKRRRNEVNVYGIRRFGNALDTRHTLTTYDEDGHIHMSIVARTPSFGLYFLTSESAYIYKLTYVFF